jgi:hypothetical protein
MKSIRRLGAVTLLAAALAVTPASAVAADQAVTSTTVTRDEACAKLAELIAFLEGRPASPLRDFLLAAARRLDLRYCS